MNLDNASMIKQARATTAREVEVIYWIMETALDDGNEEKARILFQDLAYLGKYNQQIIKDGLQPPYRERLKAISHEFYGNGSFQIQQAVAMKHEVSSRKIPFKAELELSNYLFDNSKILSDAIEEHIKITGREVELKNDYRCDIVAESATKLYPIELKIAQSTHAVVSQCSKYCYYFYRQLRYDRFKHIQGIVISNGADEWSINAIRKEGHWLYIMVPTSGTDIALERVS